MTTAFSLLAALLLLAPNASHAMAQCVSLHGSVGRSSEFGSGWITFASPVDVAAGDTLKFTVAGSARRVVLRLLPRGASPESPTGIIGDFAVERGGRIVAVVPMAAKSLVQFSAHALRSPWGLYDLGVENGPVALLGVEHCAPKPLPKAKL